MLALLHFLKAAAFGRLCVETTKQRGKKMKNLAAAFGRLCVETSDGISAPSEAHAAAFGRLCVETLTKYPSLH